MASAKVLLKVPNKLICDEIFAFFLFKFITAGVVAVVLDKHCTKKIVRLFTDTHTLEKLEKRPIHPV